MKRIIMAIVLIAAGLFSLFCEVTITRGRNYSIKITALGSKLEVRNYEEIKETVESGTDMLILSGIGSRNLEEVLDRMLSGDAYNGELYYAARKGTVCNFRSLTDLVIPVLPEGCKFEDNMSSVAWSDQGFIFEFSGEITGSVYVTDRYSDKHWTQYYEGREYRKAGNWKVFETEQKNHVTVKGEKGQNRFYVMFWPQRDSVPDEVLAKFDLKKHVSIHPKVLLYYGVHTLRLLGMAAAASGGILLVCQFRKMRDKTKKQKV